MQVKNSCPEFNFINQLDNLREKIVGTFGMEEVSDRRDVRGVST